MDLRKRFTIITAKSASQAVKLLGRGQGTAFPGLITERLSPRILADFAMQIPETVLITGTNGKTTTQQAITSILQASGKNVLSNTSGSNMRRGLLSLFVNKSSLAGKINFDSAVFEIEEATMPRVAADLQPKYIVVTNLYRDQLDAYGEVERTRSMIRKAIEAAPQAEVIINNDDPQLRELVKDLPNKVFTYAISPEHLLDFKYEGKAEARKHKVDFLATSIKINEDLGTRFEVEGVKYAFASPGIYNVYNALAAIALCSRMGLSSKQIEQGLLLTKVAFGRGEIISKYGSTFRLLLTKNPAGMNLVLDLLANVPRPRLIMLLNDKIADGRDVSWIWDSDFEKLLKVKPSEIYLGGSRAEELLLRLKYVYGSARESGPGQYILGDTVKVYLEPKIKQLLKYIKQQEPGRQYFVVHTYTAMLALRLHLVGRAID